MSSCRTSSQSCLTKSEECRSSLHLRRNDGILPFPPHFPVLSSPHFSSSLIAPFILYLMSSSIEGHDVLQPTLVSAYSLTTLIYLHGFGLSSAEMNNLRGNLSVIIQPLSFLIVSSPAVIGASPPNLSPLPPTFPSACGGTESHNYCKSGVAWSGKNMKNTGPPPQKTENGEGYRCNKYFSLYQRDYVNIATCLSPFRDLF